MAMTTPIASAGPRPEACQAAFPGDVLLWGGEGHQQKWEISGPGRAQG